MAQIDRPDLGVFLRQKLGIAHTYFNPDTSIKLKYPCIIYKRDEIEPKYADNDIYGLNYRYQLILVDRDPDSPFVEKLAYLPSCRFVKHYIADNLSHDVFRIYYK